MFFTLTPKTEGDSARRKEEVVSGSNLIANVKIFRRAPTLS
jgi:hypothetical protein